MSELLKQIQESKSLEGFSREQMNDLAGEIREYIIHHVSKTGGHLASNLGVIELTIALHKAFNFKQDKLLWDVGHQCYTHKLLTGRMEGFKNLRKVEGVSGFPNPKESDFDQFVVGHAGTAIPTAVGMALGQQQQEKNDKIVAVVGDASIVNGISFEALNNLNLIKRQLLIILNDNSMAIDKTTGALAKYFSKIRLSHTYEDIVKHTNNIFEHLPFIGKGVEDAIEKIKKNIRMVLPPSQIFESMNIPYFGPVDGHDINTLSQLFSELGELQTPAILHVYTKKGYGFTPAGDQPEKYHSTKPFIRNGDKVEEPTFERKGKTFTDCFGEHLADMADKDDKIVGITCAMSAGTGLIKLKERHPEKFYDVGIAESLAVDIGAGLAKEGLKPFVCIYSTFLQRSFDQIFQEVSLQDLPVVFCIDRAGFVGSDGPTHNGLMDIGFLRMLPDIEIIAPACETEVRLAMDYAANADKCVCIRYPKDIVCKDLEKLESLKTPFERGTSVSIKEIEDPDLRIAAAGPALKYAVKVAEKLKDENFEAEVINARFAAPVDTGIVEKCRDLKPIITVEDHSKAGGFGSALSEALIDEGINPKFKIIAAERQFYRHDKRESQLQAAGISAENIYNTAKEMLEKNRS